MNVGLQICILMNVWLYKLNMYTYLMQYKHILVKEVTLSDGSEAWMSQPRLVTNFCTSLNASFVVALPRVIWMRSLDSLSSPNSTSGKKINSTPLFTWAIAAPRWMARASASVPPH